MGNLLHHKYHLPPCELPKKANILDLGANSGYTMVSLAALYPDSHVYGVEMDFGNFSLAQKNIAAIGNRCKIMHAAVWYENTEISYEGYAENNFSIFNKLGNFQGKGTGRAPAKTIDKILNEFGLTSVDYLKMDIEGAENEVFKNPSKWIDDIKSMKVEIHKPANIDEIIEILKSYNFRCHKDDSHPACVVAIKKSK
jgi:FkbM family methyltransferase